MARLIFFLSLSHFSTPSPFSSSSLVEGFVWTSHIRRAASDSDKGYGSPITPDGPALMRHQISYSHFTNRRARSAPYCSFLFTPPPLLSRLKFSMERNRNDCPQVAFSRDTQPNWGTGEPSKQQVRHLLDLPRRVEGRSTF